MAIQPTATLTKGLLMGVDSFYFTGCFGRHHQVMVNPDLYLTTNTQIRIKKVVQGVVNHAFR